MWWRTSRPVTAPTAVSVKGADTPYPDKADAMGAMGGPFARIALCGIRARADRPFERDHGRPPHWMISSEDQPDPIVDRVPKPPVPDPR